MERRQQEKGRIYPSNTNGECSSSLQCKFDVLSQQENTQPARNAALVEKSRAA